VEAAVEAGVERAVAAQREPVAQLGEADEDEREECPAIPLAVEEDVEVVEGVLVEEMRFVEEEDGMRTFAAEVLNVGGDGVEDGGGGGRRRQPEGEAELAVEVAATQRQIELYLPMPVSSMARDGEQSGDVWWLPKRTPRTASASTVGVRASPP